MPLSAGRYGLDCVDRVLLFVARLPLTTAVHHMPVLAPLGARGRTMDVVSRVPETQLIPKVCAGCKFVGNREVGSHDPIVKGPL